MEHLNFHIPTLLIKHQTHDLNHVMVGRDGWMASPGQWTWIWASSGSWWWTGKPGVLQSMGVPKSQTQLSNWTEQTDGKIPTRCASGLLFSDHILNQKDFWLWTKWDHLEPLPPLLSYLGQTRRISEVHNPQFCLISTQWIHFGSLASIIAMTRKHLNEIWNIFKRWY